MEINGKILIYPDGREEILYEVSPGFFVPREDFYKMRAEEKAKEEEAKRREEEEKRQKEVQIVIEKPKEKKPRKEKEWTPPVRTVHPFFMGRK
jgi:hypothetical protein